MATLIKHIIGKPASTPAKEQPVECNYSNNYYGDQVCRPSVEESVSHNR